MNNFPKLYKRSTKGVIQQWQIFVDGNSYFTEAGQLDGKITRSLPTFTSAKNEGKLNASTALEQAIVEAQAKHDKKLKEKYYENIEDVDKESFISPILAQPFKKRTKPLKFPVIGNIKYNGVCCIITKDGAFSRKGEEFFNVKHIKEELAPIFVKHPDLVLHGELNNPNDQTNLNRLVEFVAVTRKEKDLDQELIEGSKQVVRYSVYDGYFEGKESDSYILRYQTISDIIHKLDYSHSIPYVYLNTEEEMIEYSNDLIEKGYEGAIIRVIDMPYEHKRSMNLLKIKRGEDAEFKIVQILEGIGNWAGCAKKIEVELEKEYHHLGRTIFELNLDGTMENAREIWNNRQNYPGKWITGRFQARSEYGVPLSGYTNGLVRNYE